MATHNYPASGTVQGGEGLQLGYPAADFPYPAGKAGRGKVGQPAIVFVAANAGAGGRVEAPMFLD